MNEDLHYFTSVFEKFNKVGHEMSRSNWSEDFAIFNLIIAWLFTEREYL